MNYLAHLHIAQHCQSSPLGNLLGDFVKGDPASQYPKAISDGIKLHRFVDSFTDSHEIMAEIKPLFPKETRRYSGIALDMFWDHCLAANWQEHHSESLDCFSHQMARVTQDEYRGQLPERYKRVSASMWRDGWLMSYQHMDNIEFALERIALRSARMAPLASCFATLDTHYSQLKDLFEHFYPEVLSEAARKHQSL